MRCIAVLLIAVTVGCGSDADLAAPTEPATPAVAIVPDVEDKTPAAARIALELAGFKVRSETRTMESYPEGDVFSQSPPAGREMEAGDTVTILIAEAPPKPGEIVGDGWTVQIEEGSCSTEYGFFTFAGTITNDLSTSASYSIATGLYADDDVRLGEGLAVVSSVAAGETASWESTGAYNDSSPPGRCGVVSVDAM